MNTYLLTQGCAIASSGQCTGITVGEHGHLAALGDCLLQEVVSSQVSNAPIILEVFLQHVFSIADHSGADKGLSASGPRLAPPYHPTLLLKKTLTAVRPKFFCFCHLSLHMLTEHLLCAKHWVAQ